MAICYSLKAGNSSGLQLLHFDIDKERQEVGITLTGNFDNKEIQVDFDVMSKDEFLDFFEVMEIIKKRLGETNERK